MKYHPIPMAPPIHCGDVVSELECGAGDQTHEYQYYANDPDPTRQAGSSVLCLPEPSAVTTTISIRTGEY